MTPDLSYLAVDSGHLGRSIAIFDRFHCGSSWGILGIDSPRLSSPDRLRLDQLNRKTNWLFSLRPGARIATAGILGIQINTFTLIVCLPPPT